MHVVDFRRYAYFLQKRLDRRLTLSIHTECDNAVSCRKQNKKTTICIAFLYLFFHQERAL